MAAGQADTSATQIVFPTASIAFESGLRACEAVYTAIARGEKSDPNKPGPFSQRGFYMSATGDEAKVNVLMLGRQAHVYKGNVKGDVGKVYVLFSVAPLACRVGSFDAPDSHQNTVKYLADDTSGWVSQPTESPSPIARMQMYRKAMAGAVATVNLSWAVVQGSGPNGLAAMATMIVAPATPAQ